MIDILLAGDCSISLMASNQIWFYYLFNPYVQYLYVCHLCTRCYMVHSIGQRILQPHSRRLMMRQTGPCRVPLQSPIRWWAPQFSSSRNSISLTLYSPKTLLDHWHVLLNSTPNSIGNIFANWKKPIISAYMFDTILDFVYGPSQ